MTALLTRRACSSRQQPSNFGRKLWSGSSDAGPKVQPAGAVPVKTWIQVEAVADLARERPQLPIDPFNRRKRHRPSRARGDTE